jgi:hypothetical protein
MLCNSKTSNKSVPCLVPHCVEVVSRLVEEGQARDQGVADPYKIPGCLEYQAEQVGQSAEHTSRGKP